MEQQSDEDATREFNFRKLREQAKNLVQSGDEHFGAGRLGPAQDAYSESFSVVRKLDARNPADVRWKQAYQQEVLRRSELVISLLPKAQKEDALAAMKAKRLKEAAEAAGADDSDPEMVLKRFRRTTRDTCDRIKNQLRLALEHRDAVEVSPSLPDEDPPAEEEVTSVQAEEADSNTKIGCLAQQLVADMKRRRPVVVPARVKFDGVRGVQIISSPEEEPEERSVGQQPVSKASVQEPLPLPSQEDLVNDSASSEDRLLALVGAPFASSPKDPAAPVDALEAEILRDIEKNLKLPLAQNTSPYTASGIAVLEMDGVEMGPSHGYAMAPDRTIGREHRMKLGLRPTRVDRDIGSKYMREINEARTLSVLREVQVVERTRGASSLASDCGPLANGAGREALPPVDLGREPVAPALGSCAASPPPIERAVNPATRSMGHEKKQITPGNGLAILRAAELRLRQFSFVTEGAAIIKPTPLSDLARVTSLSRSATSRTEAIPPNCHPPGQAGFSGPRG